MDAGTVDRLTDARVGEQGDFVGEDELGDGEVCWLRRWRGALRRWRRDRGLARLERTFRRVGCELGCGDDEAAADGVEDCLGEDGAGVVEGGEAHAVGVRGCGLRGGRDTSGRGGRGGRSGSVKGMGWEPPSEMEDWCVRMRRAMASMVGGVDGVGGFAGEAEEDGAVGAVADAGEGERAVEIDEDAGGAVEEVCGVSSRTKRRAARMGPTVWELEGPIPILKSSKRLVFMRPGPLDVGCRPLRLCERSCRRWGVRGVGHWRLALGGAGAR